MNFLLIAGIIIFLFNLILLALIIIADNLYNHKLTLGKYEP